MYFQEWKDVPLKFKWAFATITWEWNTSADSNVQKFEKKGFAQMYKNSKKWFCSNVQNFEKKNEKKTELKCQRR